LFPGWRAGYRLARAVDDGILRVPFLRRLGSNFELVARKLVPEAEPGFKGDA